MEKKKYIFLMYDFFLEIISAFDFCKLASVQLSRQ